MATKKYLELQEFSDADLQAELEATESRYQKMKFDHAITGLDNPLVLREGVAMATPKIFYFNILTHAQIKKA